MTYQYLRVSDTSYRSTVIYGDNPPLWKFGQHQKADIVVINLGTNDANGAHGKPWTAFFVNGRLMCLGRPRRHGLLHKLHILLHRTN